MKKTRVAIIEDHQLVLEGLSRIIKDLPRYDLSMTASNGAEFIDALRNEEVPPPDIALIDIHMPVMDGFETVAYLKENYPSIKCISISSDFEDQTIARIVLAGARAFLMKDTSISVLRATMDVVRDMGYCHHQEVIEALQNSQRPGNSEERKERSIRKEISKREMEFLQHLCNMKMETYQDLGDAMNLSARTVEQYRVNLCKKFDLRGKSGLILFALKWNLAEITGTD